MKIENKDFWEIDNVIEVQENMKKSAEFEIFMFKKAKEIYSKVGDIKSIKILVVELVEKLKLLRIFLNQVK
jgi:hypothetical protein